MMASTMSSPMAQKKNLKTGWLRKQGGMVRSWHRRWFVLNGDLLFYFAKEDDAKALGTIYLPGNRIIEHSFRPDEPEKFLFEILPGKGMNRMTPGHESYMICAHSEAERKDWIKHIRRVMFRDVGGAIFGLSILETMTYEKREYPGRKIPWIVEECVEFLTKNGLDIEGIFRLPGRTSMIRELKETFDCGERLKLEVDQHDVHTVASLLKLYLRELPESIIPTNFYQKVMNIASRCQQQEHRDHVGELKAQLALIPEDNYNILEYLCKFVHKVGQHVENNKMTEMNLATVFGPNIIRHLDDNPELFMLTADLTHQLAFLLIHNYDEIFCQSVKRSEVPVDDLLGLGNEQTQEPNLDILTAVSHQLGIQFSPEPSLVNATTTSVGVDKDNLHASQSFKTNKVKQPIRQVKSLTLPARPIPPKRKSRMKKNLEIQRSESEGGELKLSDTSPNSPETPDKWFDPPESPTSWNGPGRNRGHVVYSEDQFSSVVVTNNNNSSLEFSPTEVLQQQNDVLKETLSRTKSKYDSQQKSLIADRENLKSEYDLYISKLEAQHLSQINALKESLERTQDQQSLCAADNDKIRPSIPEIHLQNASLKDELSRTRSKYEVQVNALKSELTNMKANNDNLILRLEEKHRAIEKDLKSQLEAEKAGRAEAVSRIVSLQSQLQQYQMKYGEI